MMTVKEVSKLTGVSVRMLHYYDKIDLFKPSKINESGYRLYDENDLSILQQILFFKELEIPLKEIKDIMNSPYFDKIKTLENQKKLLTLKRDRLNGLIELIDKTIKGENAMSFEEFDTSEYYKVWEDYRNENKDRVIDTFGSDEKFDEMIKVMHENEDIMIKEAVKVYGGMKNYIKAIKEQLNNKAFLKVGDESRRYKKDILKDSNSELINLYKDLSADLYKIPSDKYVQEIAAKISEISKRDYEIFNDDKGDNHWYSIMTAIHIDPLYKEKFDNKFGEGAAKFISEVFKIYLKDKKPKLQVLYKDLASKLGEEASSKEVQDIVLDIVKTTKENNEYYNKDINMNYKGFFSQMSDLYLKNADGEDNVFDKKYGKGASKFIGEAFKYYAEN